MGKLISWLATLITSTAAISAADAAPDLISSILDPILDPLLSSLDAPWHGAGRTAGSPAYNYIFERPLPIPLVATPCYSRVIDGRALDFYTLTIEQFSQQIYPNLGPTHLIGYNGTSPGPTFRIKRGTETIVRVLNHGNLTASVHLHGSYTHAAWDGWAADEIDIDEWKDYYYPNSENARTMWYHDHAEGHTSLDAYYGQAGTYIIYDPNEDMLGLPTGQYDISLALTDKIYQQSGELAAPTSRYNFYGDVIQVNGQPWPFLDVEPRRYRFRFVDMALSRAFLLYFAGPDGQPFPVQVIASDSGLFGSPVKTESVTISPGERYEVVVDFSSFSGQNVTLGNNMQSAAVQEFKNTNEVMLFRVGQHVTDNSNNGPVPSTLNRDIQWPPRRDIVDHHFNFQMGGDDLWTINGIDFNDVNNRVLARPPQGTVELWELHHTGGPVLHPVHVHLVNLQVVSRSGGSRGLLPYETAGLKDVVLLEPGETVRVLAYYGPWNGAYMFHCHDLIHEDNLMLVAFNVTRLAALGYEFDNTMQFAKPDDVRFAPRPFRAADYSPAAISSAVASLAALSAYQPVTALMAAENQYYATAGYHGDAAAPSPTMVASPVRSNAQSPAITRRP